MRRWLLALVAALALVPSSAPADPYGNQLVSWSAACTGKTEGVFAYSGATPAACASTPGLIITWANFTGNFVHTGTCGSGNPLPSWSQLLTCRGSGSTATTQNFNTSGVLYMSRANSFPPPNYVCSVTGGANSVTFTMPSSTLAPTSSATQLTWTPTAIAANTTGGTGSGTGVVVTLVNPSGTQVGSATTVPNGSTTPLTYSATGAPAGAWQWVVSGMGTQACSITTGAVVGNTAENVAGMYSWFQ